MLRIRKMWSILCMHTQGYKTVEIRIQQALPFWSILCLFWQRLGDYWALSWVRPACDGSDNENILDSIFMLFGPFFCNSWRLERHTRSFPSSKFPKYLFTSSLLTYYSYLKTGRVKKMNVLTSKRLIGICFSR